MNINLINDIMNNMIKIISTIGDISIFFITIYTFRLTIFPKKLKLISFSVTKSIYSGDLIEVDLENRAISPITIKKIYLLNNMYKIEIFKGKIEIDGFKTGQIKMEPYSTIYPDNLKIGDIRGKNIVLWIETSRGIQIVKWKTRKFLKKFLFWKYRNYKYASVIRNHYNDKIITSKVKYIITFNNNGERKTILIQKNGYMSENIFGYNVLPKEMIEDKNYLKRHFDSEFEKYGIEYHLKEF